MSVPSTASLKRPVLMELMALGGTGTARQLIDGVLSKQSVYGLSVDEGDLQLQDPSGGKTVRHRFHTALSLLKKGGLVAGAVAGQWTITAAGIAAIGGVGPPPPPPPPPAPTAASPISLTNLIAEHMRGLTYDLAHRIASLSAEQFEELVKVVLEQLGYSDVRRVGGPGDRNIDVIAVHRAPFIKVPIRVQVKHRRGAPNVGPTDVAAFRDRAGGADHVLLMVTNAEFTDGAKETASEAGRQVVHLVDGKDLIKRMIDEGIGLRQGVMGILHVDEDFWREMEK